MRASDSLISFLFITYVTAKPSGGSGEYTLTSNKKHGFENLPGFLHPCSRSDRSFNSCVKHTLQTFFKSVVNGSKELNLPVTDPLFIPKLIYTLGTEEVKLNFDFRDFCIAGLGNAQVISVGTNLEVLKLEMTIKYPYLDIFGQFTCDGGLKSFPIMGNGDFSFNMTDVTAAWIIYFAETEPFMSQKYLTIDQFTIDIIPVQISAKFGEEIDGENTLGYAANSFFNENAQEFFKITKPKMMDALSRLLGSLANQVLSRFPKEVLLPP